MHVGSQGACASNYLEEALIQDLSLMTNCGLINPEMCLPPKQITTNFGTLLSADLLYSSVNYKNCI